MEIENREFEKALSNTFLSYTGINTGDYYAALKLAIQSGMSANAERAGKKIGELMYEFEESVGRQTNHAMDVCALVVDHISVMAVSEISDFGVDIEFDNYYNYLDYNIQLTEESVEALHNLVKEKIEEDPEWSLADSMSDEGLYALEAGGFEYKEVEEELRNEKPVNK